MVERTPCIGMVCGTISLPAVELAQLSGSSRGHRPFLRGCPLGRVPSFGVAWWCTGWVEMMRDTTTVLDMVPGGNRLVMHVASN